MVIFIFDYVSLQIIFRLCMDYGYTIQFLTVSHNLSKVPNLKLNSQCRLRINHFSSSWTATWRQELGLIVIT